MADDQIQPSDQDPLENEGQTTNRPADQARIGRAGEAESFDWALSDEATDFLGLNDAVGDGSPETVQPAAEGADPYSMPGAAPVDEASRTNWLLNEAAQAAPPGYPQAQPGAYPAQPQMQPGMQPQMQPGMQPGQPGAEQPTGKESWLLDGSEPAPLPAPQRDDLPLPESIQDAAVATQTEGKDPNWLLGLDDKHAGEGGMAPVVPGSQGHGPTESPRGLDASFVDPEPKGRAVGRLVRRGLTAAAAVAGGLVVWQVLSHHGEVVDPVTEPVQLERDLARQELVRPVDHDPDLGARGERQAITPERGANTRTAPASGTRWYSNLANDPAGTPSEPAELDPDSYPWPAPTVKEVRDARSVLLAFDALMGDAPLAEADVPVRRQPERVVSTAPTGSFMERFAQRMINGARGEVPRSSVAPELDSLGVVPPDALAEVGPPVADTGAGPQLPFTPRWTKLEERLVPADRSVLDQYNAWRLAGDSVGRRMDYVARIGSASSLEPTLALPYIVATIGVGEGFLREGPRPAGLAEADRALTRDPGSTDAFVGLDPLASSEPETALDPRRIEKDPLFSVVARIPGVDVEERVLENRWMGTNVPMQALDYPDRVLTPRVGFVRVLHDNGEGFEGRLFAMGQGIVWVDTGIGRMTLEGSSIERIERIDESRQRAIASGAEPTAGLERVRVRARGGVFVGFELYRENDQITMLTEEGYKITLPSEGVESAATSRASVGIKRRGR